MRESKLLEAVVPFLYAAAVLLTFGQYGITWDEPVQSRYGELAVDYFLSGGANTAVNDLLDLRYYGPLFEEAAAAVYRFAPAHKYEIRHLLVALTAIATVIGAGRLAKAAGASAIAAQLLLACNPQFYGHGFANSKDIPFACAAVWMMVAVVRAIREEKPGWKDAVLIAVPLGAAMGIRPGGLLLAAITAAALLLARRWRALGLLGVATVAAWVLMVLVWPWAHQNPIGNPLAALRMAAAFPYTQPVLFEGAPVPAPLLPRRYLFEMLAITMPLATLVLAAIGIGAALKRLQALDVVLLCWLLLPLLVVLATRPTLYDGIRHFLFLVPAFAVFGAMGVQTVPQLRAGVVAVAVAAPLLAMIRLHPYEATYYNAIVGGTRGAAARFETDYWASSYREAALWLREHRCAGRRTRVLVAATVISRDALAHYLPRDGFQLARMQERTTAPLPPEVDYYVATTRYGWSNNFPTAPIVHVVGRDGASFSVIRGGGCH